MNKQWCRWGIINIFCSFARKNEGNWIWLNTLFSYWFSSFQEVRQALHNRRKKIFSAKREVWLNEMWQIKQELSASPSPTLISPSLQHYLVIAQLIMCPITADTPSLRHSYQTFASNFMAKNITPIFEWYFCNEIMATHAPPSGISLRSHAFYRRDSV